jgi:hypothetical protein
MAEGAIKHLLVFYEQLWPLLRDLHIGALQLAENLLTAPK